MEITRKENNGIVCIAINGRMGSELSPELEKIIKEIVAGGKRRLLFDLGALDYLRSVRIRKRCSTVLQKRADKVPGLTLSAPTKRKKGGK